MKKVYEIKDKNLIQDILVNAEFGTLAICLENKPYSLPINYVEIDGEIFMHGAKKGKKIDIMENNKNASFSVVESYSLLPSYFSTDDGRASPATHMFKSIIIDGKIEFIENYEEKANALELLMQKYQKEGGYKPLNESIYKKIINATCIYKIVPEQTSAKFHMGQDYNDERFERVCTHLKERGTTRDLATLKLMKSLRE
jgi:nitroimidazol reductase NimA-like FMN-containing flavoprotein (pyridoxamine 5'-phosphate oxidase superfamily)